jgi:hypothetical protein
LGLSGLSFEDALTKYRAKKEGCSPSSSVKLEERQVQIKQEMPELEAAEEDMVLLEYDAPNTKKRKLSAEEKDGPSDKKSKTRHQSPEGIYNKTMSRRERNALCATNYRMRIKLQRLEEKERLQCLEVETRVLYGQCVFVVCTQLVVARRF